MENTSKVYNGMHSPQTVLRVVETEDPGAPGKKIVTKKRFDLIKGLVIERVSGHGKTETTGEPYVTLTGQYAPFKRARITVGSQQVEPVRDLLKDYISKDDPTLTVTKPLIVDVVASPMKGFGFTVEELYLVNEDGSRKVIVGPPITESGSENSATSTNFLL